MARKPWSHCRPEGIGAKGPEYPDMPLSNVAVIGAGTMGAGIAALAALGGSTTQLCDQDPGQLERAFRQLRQRLHDCPPDAP